MPRTEGGRSSREALGRRGRGPFGSGALRPLQFCFRNLQIRILRFFRKVTTGLDLRLARVSETGVVPRRASEVSDRGRNRSAETSGSRRAADRRGLVTDGGSQRPLWASPRRPFPQPRDRGGLRARALSQHRLPATAPTGARAFTPLPSMCGRRPGRAGGLPGGLRRGSPSRCNVSSLHGGRAGAAADTSQLMRCGHSHPSGGRGDIRPAFQSLGSGGLGRPHQGGWVWGSFPLIV